MTHDPTMPGRPWRLVILDDEPGDLKLMLVTVAEPADVRPAVRGETADDVIAWIRDRTGTAHALTRMPGAICWRVEPAR